MNAPDDPLTAAAAPVEAARFLGGFDDTYEHEVWNRSGRTRAILLMDAWNPHLTVTERAVLPQVIEAMNVLGAEIQAQKPAVL